MHLIGKVGETNIYLEGVNVYSEDGEYFFSFITHNAGFKGSGTKDIPFDILEVAKKTIFGDLIVV